MVSWKNRRGYCWDTLRVEKMRKEGTAMTILAQGEPVQMEAHRYSWVVREFSLISRIFDADTHEETVGDRTIQLKKHHCRRQLGFEGNVGRTC